VHLYHSLPVRLLTFAVGVCLYTTATATPTSAQTQSTTGTAKTPSSSEQSAKKPAAKAPAKKAPAKKAYSAKQAQARKAALARARAHAQTREEGPLKEAMEPRFRTDETGALVPDVRAAAAIIFNPETGEVLYEINAQDKRSIASITKVMTALVFLEDNPDLSRPYVVHQSDVTAASITYLRPGERVSAEDLLHLTLIASDNGAARALARISHGGPALFIQRMNEKAVELGLESTTFADSSGLSPNNISSAYDLSRMIAYASVDDRIADMMRKPEYRLSTNRRAINLRNTNRLLSGGELDVRGGKTGFITKAGYCLATLLRLPQGDQVAVVVLGAHSNALRFSETRHLVNWMSEKAASILVDKQPE
jgi:serine-type D-Ala-D-Ala endopeptidase (penicillin-binding protein 7)